MTQNPLPPNDIRSLWQSIPIDPVTVSIDEMRVRAKAFEKKIRRRNFIEYAASVFVTVAFAWYATLPIGAWPLWPIANIMIIAGILVVVVNLHRKTRAATPPSGASAEALVDFQRAEFVRQRDALKTTWRWYIFPIIPGLVLWFIAMGLGFASAAGDLGRAFIVLGGAGLAALLVFAAIVLLNLLGAAHLQRQIDALDSYKDNT